LSASNLATDPTVFNEKGDNQEPFDRAVHQLIINELTKQFKSGIVISEEGEPLQFGKGRPDHCFVVDPVDGSNNWRRGLPLSALCIAALPSSEMISLDAVEWAIVCNLFEAHTIPCVAVRGEGAWQGTTRLRHRDRALSEAIVSVELDQSIPSAGLVQLMRRAAGIRSFCCTAMSLAMIALGNIDAHIDIRKRVTPESYLASSLILTESGGRVCDELGSDLSPFFGLTDRRSILAVCGTSLLAEVVHLLSDIS
jgi:myo-inositol-1(or 4)-monophosphatase